MLKMIRGAGFTLLEVLVALAILATSMYAGMYLLNRSIANAGTVEEKISAHWVAQNALVQAELAGTELKELEISEQPVTMLGRKFLLSVATEVLENSDDEAARDVDRVNVTIRVAPASEPSRPVEQITFDSFL